MWSSSIRSATAAGRARVGDEGLHVVSIGYLALTRTEEVPLGSGVQWSAWYAHFPWEDWRNGKPPVLSREIEPRLDEWASRPEAPGTPRLAACPHGPASHALRPVGSLGR